MKVGDEEGSRCARGGCSGVIEAERVENCSCHISPPCWRCTSAGLVCPKCGWESADDDVVIDELAVSADRPASVFRTWTPRQLDTSRIDWHNRSHSSSSMLRDGVYPPEATMAEVEAKVIGTFGGRFESFGGGKFKYIAYTD